LRLIVLPPPPRSVSLGNPGLQTTQTKTTPPKNGRARSDSYTLKLHTQNLYHFPVPYSVHLHVRLTDGIRSDNPPYSFPPGKRECSWPLAFPKNWAPWSLDAYPVWICNLSLCLRNVELPTEPDQSAPSHFSLSPSFLLPGRGGKGTKKPTLNREPLFTRSSMTRKK